MRIYNPTISGSILVSGSGTISGSWTVTGGITGSLFGTSSWADNATTLAGANVSTFATTGSNIFNGNQVITGSLISTLGLTGSLLGTSSWANNATNALTASFAPNYVLNSATSSFVTTASVSLNTITFTKGDGSTFPITVNTGSGGSGGNAFPFTGSAQITGSLTVTGSVNSTNGFTGSLLGTSSWANNVVSASFALTASYFSGSISNAISASYAETASFVPNIVTQTQAIAFALIFG